mmetsp:Transcript_1742/g.3871  ORF Transcript_1742/g.3871 Transcript_1742/m.3871 type:complete len:168 (+) Transcript_1742:113-616(+)
MRKRYAWRGRWTEGSGSDKQPSRSHLRPMKDNDKDKDNSSPLCFHRFYHLLFHRRGPTKETQFFIAFIVFITFPAPPAFAFALAFALARPLAFAFAFPLAAVVAFLAVAVEEVEALPFALALGLLGALAFSIVFFALLEPTLAVGVLLATADFALGVFLADAAGFEL